jgi:serine/threonine kinase PknH
VPEEMFGPYRIEQLLGRGGMGEVHRAFDTRRQRTVALKRLPTGLSGDPGFIERFRRESELASRLNNAHIVPIHDFGEIDGTLFIDMRLVEGTDLSQLIARTGPLAVARAVQIVSQIADALDAAHADGLIHRDVKPSNVLVTTDSEERDFCYLIDFGIARRLHGHGATALTATNAFIGSIARLHCSGAAGGQARGPQGGRLCVGLRPLRGVDRGDALSGRPRGGHVRTRAPTCAPPVSAAARSTAGS